MSKIDTISMIKEMAKNPKAKFQTELDGKILEVYVNQNGGISTKNERNTVTLSGDIMLAKWERVQEKYTFMEAINEAINSDKNIKPASGEEYKCFDEVLYDLIDCTGKRALEYINGYWNIGE